MFNNVFPEILPFMR